MLLRSELLGYDTNSSGAPKLGSASFGVSGHPLGQGLVGAWAFNQIVRLNTTPNLIVCHDRSGYNHHLIGQLGANTPMYIGYQPVSDPIEMGVMSGSTNNFVTAPVLSPSPNANPGDAKIMELKNLSTGFFDCTVGFKFRAFPTGFHPIGNLTIFSLGSGAVASANGFGLVTDNNSNALQLENTTGNTTLLTPASSTEFRTYFLRIQGTSNTAYNYWLYGSVTGSAGRGRVTLITSGSRSGHPSTATAVRWLVGNGTTTALNRGMGGDMSWLMVWRRQLFPAEMNAISEHPFQMIGITRPFASTFQLIPPVDLIPTGLAHTNQFGSAHLVVDSFHQATGIPSATAIGTPFVLDFNAIYPNTIPHTNQFGSATVIDNKIFTATGFSDPDLFGNALVADTNKLYVTGLSNVNAFGSHTLQINSFHQATGFASANAFGSHALNQFVFYGFTSRSHTLE